MEVSQIAAAATLLDLLIEHRESLMTLVVVTIMTCATAVSLPTYLMHRSVMALSESLKSLSREVASSEAANTAIIDDFRQKYDGRETLIKAQQEQTERVMALVERVTRAMTRLEEKNN